MEASTDKETSSTHSADTLFLANVLQHLLACAEKSLSLPDKHPFTISHMILFKELNLSVSESKRFGFLNGALAIIQSIVCEKDKGKDFLFYSTQMSEMMATLPMLALSFKPVHIYVYIYI